MTKKNKRRRVSRSLLARVLPPNTLTTYPTRTYSQLHSHFNRTNAYDEMDYNITIFKNFTAARSEQIQPN